MEKLREKLCRRLGQRQTGNVGDIMITGICVLALSVVLLSYMDSIQLVQQKINAGQLARKYILRMETVGCLTAEDCTLLTCELQEMGVTEISYEGTTQNPVGYGNAITLKIQGKLGGEYAFLEQRVSTAKN